MDNQNRTVLIRFFVGLMVIVVIGVLAWLIFFRDNPDKKKDAQTGQAVTSQGAKNTGTGDDTNAASGTSASNPGQAEQDAAQTGQTNSANTQLVASGPDGSVVVFVSAMVIGTAAHYLYHRKLRY